MKWLNLIMKQRGVIMKKERAKKRLEEIRESLRAENVSYGELSELACLVDYIEVGDVELLEAAGVPENTEE